MSAGKSPIDLHAVVQAQLTCLPFVTLRVDDVSDVECDALGEGTSADYWWKANGLESWRWLGPLGVALFWYIGIVLGRRAAKERKAARKAKRDASREPS